MTADLVEAFSAIRGEPAWLRDLRLRGWETFSSQPMPTMRDEGWRRTDLRGLDLDALLNPPAHLPAPSQLAECVQRVLARADDVAGTLIVQDSAEVSSDLDPDLAAKGVQLLSLERAIQAVPDRVQAALLSTRVD